MRYSENILEVQAVVVPWQISKQIGDMTRHVRVSHLLMSSCYGKRSSVNNALYTGHTTLYDFSTRQHLFHWTRSVTTEHPRSHSGLLKDVGCHPAASLSFNVNDSNSVREHLTWHKLQHTVNKG